MRAMRWLTAVVVVALTASAFAAGDVTAEQVDGNGPVTRRGEKTAEIDLGVAAALHAVEHQHGRRVRVLAGYEHALEVDAVVLVVERRRGQLGHDANVPTPTRWR